MNERLLTLALGTLVGLGLAGCETSDGPRDFAATPVAAVDSSGHTLPTADLSTLPTDARQAVEALLGSTNTTRDARYVATSVTLDHYGDIMCGRGHLSTADRREVWAVVLVGPFPGPGPVPHAFLTPTPTPLAGSQTRLVILDRASGISLQSLSPWPQPRDPAVRC